MLVAAGPANPPLAFPSGCFLDVPAPPTSVLLNLLPLFDSGGCNGYMGITLTALRSPPVSVHFQVVIRDSVVGWITTNGVTVQIP